MNTKIYIFATKQMAKAICAKISEGEKLFSIT